jgi:hypothetical protein
VKLVAQTKCKEGGVLLYPRDQRMDGTRMAACARGEMGQLSAAQRKSMHAHCRPQRGCQRQRPHMRATPSELSPYATVQAELAKVLGAVATHDEERCASASCLRGYTQAKGS